MKKRIEKAESALLTCQAECAKLREALSPFGHPDLAKKVVGQEYDESPVFGRDKALLLRSDFIRAQEALSHSTGSKIMDTVEERTIKPLRQQLREAQERLARYDRRSESGESLGDLFDCLDQLQALKLQMAGLMAKYNPAIAGALQDDERVD